jgi:ubiquinone biosynthesis protein
VIDEPDREPLRDDLYVLLHDFGSSDELSQYNFGLLVAELTEAMRRYRLRVPMSLMLLLKVLIMVLDIGVRLDPKFNFGKEVTPYLSKLADARNLSAAYLKRASVSLLDAADALFDMPRNLNLMLRRISSGTFNLKIEETNIQKVQVALDKASDKVMIGLVVASLVVGSSLVLLAHPLLLPDYIYWVAIFGYTFAVLVGFYAIYHVIFLKFHGGR